MEKLVPTAEIAIVGKGASQLSLELKQQYLANMLVVFSEELTETAPILQGKTPDSKGNALIYVCFDHACQKPVSTIEEAISQLPYLA
ncbi:hypothetical protein V8V91_07305 [Algoriphagus halophilus]|uniref:hypothetical protein n=1 Tax=Algoriphagus halophilus TaxID=226505 RepID=UPI00358EBA6C